MGNGSGLAACTSSGTRRPQEKRHWISFIGSHLIEVYGPLGELRQSRNHETLPKPWFPGGAAPQCANVETFSDFISRREPILRRIIAIVSSHYKKISRLFYMISMVSLSIYSNWTLSFSVIKHQMCASLPQLALKNCQYICNYSWLAWKKSRKETYIEIFDWFSILGCLIAQIFKMEVIIGSRERWDLFESNINQSALEASYYGAFGQKNKYQKLPFSQYTAYIK